MQSREPATPEMLEEIANKELEESESIGALKKCRSQGLLMDEEVVEMEEDDYDNFSWVSATFFAASYILNNEIFFREYPVTKDL